MNQKQWLNIVIIVISALILAFMLIGRWMNTSVDKQQAPTSEQQDQTAAKTPTIIKTVHY